MSIIVIYKLEDEGNDRNTSSMMSRNTSVTGLMDNPEENRASFAIELDPNGTCRVGAIKNQRFYLIRNQVGDINNLLQYALKKTQFPKLSAKTPQSRSVAGGNTSRTNRTVESTTTFDMSYVSSYNSFGPIDGGIKLDTNFLLNYKILIDFCFKCLGKSGQDCPNLPEEFTLFKVIIQLISINAASLKNKISCITLQVVSEDPIKISFNDPNTSYTIETILTRFFTHIAKSVWRQTGVKVIEFIICLVLIIMVFIQSSFIKAQKLVIAVPPDFAIFEKTDLKRAIEKANLEILRILSLPTAKALVISLKEQRDANLNEKVGKHVLIDINSGMI